MDSQQGQNLAFLCSTPRAGSTLLSVILANHDSIHCPPEPWILLALNSLTQSTSAYSKYGQELTEQALKQLVDHKTYVDAVRTFALTIYNTKLAEAEKKIFIDKTPRYYHITNFIDEVFPEAKKVWLLRNPFDVAASCISTWSLSIDELMGYGEITPHTFDVTISYVYFLNYFKDKRNKLKIKYEDLTNNPEKHLKQLCSFLEVKYSDKLLNYGKNQQVMATYRESVLGDKKILTHSKPHNKSIGQWAKVLSNDAISKIVETLGTKIFTELGYEYELNSALDKIKLSPNKFSMEGRLGYILDQANRYSEIRKQKFRDTEENLRICEEDRAARLTVINKQGIQLQECEMDRAARLEVIERIGKQLQECQADREARLEALEVNGKYLLECKEKLADTLKSLSKQEEVLQKCLEKLEAQDQIIDDQNKLIEEQDEKIKQLEIELSDRLAIIETQKTLILQCSEERSSLIDQIQYKETQIVQKQKELDNNIQKLNKLNEQFKTLKDLTSELIPRAKFGVIWKNETRKTIKIAEEILKILKDS
ncbi:MAG: sulfotransferase [Bacillota bacterium]